MSLQARLTDLEHLVGGDAHVVAHDVGEPVLALVLALVLVARVEAKGAERWAPRTMTMGDFRSEWVHSKMC